MTSTSTAFERARPRTAPPWSATSRRASRASTARSRPCGRWSRPGCDVIEIGLPYSDPVMDGPTIQAAAQAGARRRDPHQPTCCASSRQVAATGVPTLVMTYWNPIERYGVERFAADLAAAGGAGLITPDITPDHGAEWIAAADEHDLDKVFLVAPSSTDERIAMTTAACRGFVYATAVMGVTGARDHHVRPRRPPGAPGPARDRPPGRRRPRGQQRRPGRRGRRLCRWRDRGIGLRPHACSTTPGDEAAGLAALRGLTADLAGGRATCG